ncbi:MAG: PKD domain-containing protein [Cyclobacteriaceae bacterium]
MQKKTNKSWISLGYIAMFSALILFFISCKDDEEPTPAVADFTFVATEGTGSVVFTNTSTNGLQYLWDFGDNSEESTETSPTHVYAASGTYTVKLTALGESGTTPSIKEQEVAVTRDAVNLIDGGTFETADASKWTIVGTGAPYLPKVEFGSTDNLPQGGSGGALKVSNPDGYESGDQVEMVMYRSLELEAGKTYTISALINHGPLSATDVADGGPKEAFLSIEIADAAPSGTGQWKSSEENDSQVLLHRYCVCWMGESLAAVNGPWENAYTVAWINYLSGDAEVLDFSVPTSGTYYIGFKAGLGTAEGATFSSNGFVVDNLVVIEK